MYLPAGLEGAARFFNQPSNSLIDAEEQVTLRAGVYYDTRNPRADYGD